MNKVIEDLQAMQRVELGKLRNGGNEIDRNFHQGRSMGLLDAILLIRGDVPLDENEARIPLSRDHKPAELTMGCKREQGGEAETKADNHISHPSLWEWEGYKPNPYREAFMEYPENLIFKSEDLEDIYWANPLDEAFY
ncbi:hypothetical protein KAR91_88425 [Candidatus Pacearchaeota archaeon]|nr:hypothetical protein [Candidatus Pacearchaeota archaeon]